MTIQNQILIYACAKNICKHILRKKAFFKNATTSSVTFSSNMGNDQ